MGFVVRTRKASKAEKLERARKEAKFTFQHEIVCKVEEFQIPPPSILNLDQTNSKYVYMSKAKNG